MKKLLFLFILLLPFKAFAFSSSAQSVILMDMDSKRVIYGKDIYRVQSVASISKVMTAIVAIENGNLDDVVTVGDEILKAYGSGIYIQIGENIKLRDLIYGLLLRSGNDAALAIAQFVSGDVSNFVKKMNQTASKIGMKNTVFNNPSGLDEDKGNYSDVYDMALLMSYAMKNNEFKKITGTKNYKVKTDKNVYKWKNKNKVLFNYKYATGGKTGFTKIAKRTLITTAAHDGLNLTVVTFNDGNDFEDHQKLYEEAYENYYNYRILKKGYLKIPLENYYDNLYIKSDLKYPLSLMEKDSVKIKYSLIKKRKFKDGDVVGKADLYLGDRAVTSLNVYVKEGKKSFWDFFK